MGGDDSGDSDDSLMRAIASAPAMQPPPIRGSDRRRGLPITLIAGTVMLAMIVGLGAGVIAYGIPDGEVIPRWTLEGDGQPREVVFPGNMFNSVHNIDYTLHTDVALTAAQRGHPLTLVFVCWHGALALSLDGTPIDDVGDNAVGEHRFVIAASATDRSALHFELSSHQSAISGWGAGIAPRLLIGVVGRTPIATLNRYTALVAFVLAALFTLMHGVVFALDRRQREYGAFALTAAMAGLSILFGLFGNDFCGVFGPGILWASIGIGFLANFSFQRYALRLPPPSRWWARLWIPCILVAAAMPVSQLLWPLASVGIAILSPASLIYVGLRYIRASQSGDYQTDARLLMVAGVPFLATALWEAAWQATGHHIVAGFHSSALGIGCLIVGQVLVLARQVAVRQRTIEHADGELRRLVADRSKQLADALAKLAAQPVAPVSVGRVIDNRYRVVRALGAGGMGAVYEVERIADASHFALKLLRGRGDDETLARFAREAQITAELHHPNLVAVVDSGVADHGLYLVMELVEGGSLERERARFGDAKWGHPILAQIANGLAAIHARGIVHRDLKPGNVLLASNGARIADFGLASLQTTSEVDAHDPTVSPGLTRTNAIFGTPAYMAPELASGTKNALPSSDIFSFGVIACEVLGGRAPFAEAPLLARLAGRSTAATALDVDPIILRCVDLDPTKRPTAAELVVALRS